MGNVFLSNLKTHMTIKRFVKTTCPFKRGISARSDYTFRCIVTIDFYKFSFIWNRISNLLNIYRFWYLLRTCLLLFLFEKKNASTPNNNKLSAYYYIINCQMESTESKQKNLYKRGINTSRTLLNVGSKS